jgi:hypothetical protein
MKKQVFKIKDQGIASIIKESITDKKAINDFFKTGDKTTIEKRNIRFVSHL